MAAEKWCATLVALFVLLGLSITFGFGTSYVNDGIGFEKGNRRRILAVVKFELLMILFSMFTYFRIMDSLNSKNDLSRREKRLQLGPLSLNPRRFAVSMILIIWLSLAQIGFPLYWVNSSIQNQLFDISMISLGLWNYIVAILFVLFCISLGISSLNIFSSGRTFVKVLFRCTFLKWLFEEPRSQVIISVSVGVIISLLTFLCSDMLSLKEQVFHIRNLPPQAVGLRFAVVSDIHVGASVKKDHVAKVVDRINSENVDAVFLVGDIIDSPRSAVWRRTLPLGIFLTAFVKRIARYRYLKSKFGTFYVTGNHEYYYGNALDWFEFFKTLGIQVLDNRSVNLNGLCLAGVNDYSSGNSGIKGHKFDIDLALSNCSESEPILVLSHNPASAQQIAFNAQNRRVDLILSGHTHAGQFYTIAPIAYFVLPYFHGVYQISSHTQLLVSAGTLYQGPPMKMLGMSEIWIVSLQPFASNHSSKFGTKMLEKMGWKDGGGLGKKEQGRNDNIKLKANYSGKGLGCESSYDDTWVAHHDDFANLLHTLNQKKDDGGEGDADKNDVVASEKSKKSRSRVR
ncbi:unnamed protein product [Anisakis simplex]|uniref:Transmembrane protein with metallophosphoesterase domain (inferred by orthology to a human protein) n=1 Tax=Anisakis simplex TaxID=6269 RepID=A0A0M3K437_ANISI|nr:unnamed protein product [Anisakis simplex]